MTEKDYSLLRPFDLEAAKDGAEICYELGCPTEFIGVLNQDKPGYVLTKDQNHVLFSSTNRKILRLSPLCWVEGKPVYPGDVLERENGKAFIPDMVAISGELRMLGEGLPSFLNPELLRWPRPKPVKRWINVYPDATHDNRETADANAHATRIACIEIELPPLPTK